VDQPHLREPNSSLVSLVQAYFQMVGDVRYNQDFTLIAGHLMLQSPEEDAFWTLVQLMETHLRGYFVFNPVQLGVDSTLFVKALDSFDSQLSIHLFAELHVKPIDLIQAWFTSLFSRTLPPDLQHRVWDYFLYEGPVFLFRVGLALLSLCRRQLFAMKSPSPSVLGFLVHLPPEAFPPDPETFLQLCGSVKLKDDDIRKARQKMVDNILKEHMQQRTNGGRSISQTPSLAGKRRQ